MIDDAKKTLGVSTDYELGKQLQIKQQRLTDYRRGERVPDAYACAKLADVLGIDPFRLLVDIKAHTEKNAVRRAYWERKRDDR